jgi:hypothetical protein
VDRLTPSTNCIARKGPAVGLTYVEDLDDVGVLHASREPSLGVEARDEVRRVHQMGLQQLDGHHLLKVSRAPKPTHEDLPHPSGGQSANQLVAALHAKKLPHPEARRAEATHGLLCSGSLTGRACH